MSNARVVDDVESKLENENGNTPLIDHKTRFDFIAVNSLLLGYCGVAAVIVGLIMAGSAEPSSTRKFSKEMKDCLSDTSWAWNATMSLHKEMHHRTGNTDNFDQLWVRISIVSMAIARKRRLFLAMTS